MIRIRHFLVLLWHPQGSRSFNLSTSFDRNPRGSFQGPQDLEELDFGLSVDIQLNNHEPVRAFASRGIFMLKSGSESKSLKQHADMSGPCSIAAHATASSTLIPQPRAFAGPVTAGRYRQANTAKVNPVPNSRAPGILTILGSLVASLSHNRASLVQFRTNSEITIISDSDGAPRHRIILVLVCKLRTAGKYRYGVGHSSSIACPLSC